MTLPSLDSLRIVLGQIESLTLRERNGLHRGSVWLQKLLGKFERLQPFRITFGVDADNA